jgi:hypothetical protein
MLQRLSISPVSAFLAVYGIVGGFLRSIRFIDRFSDFSSENIIEYIEPEAFDDLANLTSLYA